MDKKLQISKLQKIDKSVQYAVISIRINAGTAQRIEQIAKETNRSRNEILNIMLEFALEQYEIIESNQ